MAVRKPKKRTAAKKRVPSRGKGRQKTSRAAKKSKPAGKLTKRHEPETLRLRSLEPSFTVNDLTKSIRFYTEVMGFIVDEQWMDGEVLRGVMVKAGSCGFGLSQDNWAMGRDRKKGVGMRVWCRTDQDIDALASRIRAAGGQLAGEPMDQPWGARSLSIDDPDGFHLTVYRES